MDKCRYIELFAGVGGFVLQNHKQNATSASGNGRGRLGAEVYDDLGKAKDFFLIRHLLIPPSVPEICFSRINSNPVLP